MDPLARLPDPPHLIDLLREAEACFERGDNRQASRYLARLLHHELSEPLAVRAGSLRRRIRPDRRALVLALVLAVALLVIWILAIRANR